MNQQAGLGRASQLQSDPFADFEIPTELVPSLNRHRENIARFVISLHSLGLGEKEIESSVSLIVDSYKDELLSAIRAMKR